ncbi:DUF3613 domain-containing protein [Pseudomonas sp. IT-P44]|uniref:YhfG family protein n=1 Tax=Pseudomonas sp. IT-P44 TaxID=3026451 RepID=UPI0039E13C01
MSKLFDELMESVQQTNEILRGERQPSREYNVDALTMVMSELTFNQKQAHYEKVRRSNYLASLRLAGFDTSPADLTKPLLTREEALAKYRQDKLQQFAPVLPSEPDDQ